MSDPIPRYCPAHPDQVSPSLCVMGCEDRACSLRSDPGSQDSIQGPIVRPSASPLLASERSGLPQGTEVPIVRPSASQRPLTASQTTPVTYGGQVVGHRTADGSLTITDKRVIQLMQDQRIGVSIGYRTTSDGVVESLPTSVELLGQNAMAGVHGSCDPEVCAPDCPGQHGGCAP